MQLYIMHAVYEKTYYTLTYYEVIEDCLLLLTRDTGDQWLS